MRKQRLSYSEISSLCLELSMFLHAGSSTAEALNLLGEQTKESEYGKMFYKMGERIDSGLSLSSAMEDSGIFPERVYLMLRAAEKTGKTEETLVSLSRYYERLHITDGQVRSALLYPSVLMTVMMTVSVLILIYVLPIFRNVYSSLGGVPSGFAAFLLNVGVFLKEFIPLLCVFFAVMLAVLFLFSVSQNFRSKIMGMGSGKTSKIAKKTASAQFTEALALAFSGGMDPVSAVAEAAGVLDKKTSDTVRNEICVKASEGEDIWTLLKEFGILPSAEARLLSIGVKSGNAELCAQKTAERLGRDAEEAIENAVAYIEPFTVIISCVLIGTVLLSVMLPLARIMSSIG